MRYIIVATDAKNGIGLNGGLPWKFANEMNYFRKITTASENGKQNAVIMGRKTWESIPQKFKPLPNRLNIIISRSNLNHTHVFQSLNKALEYLEYYENVNDIFFVGGSGIYKEVINNKLYDGVYLTKIHRVYKCDTFFPELKNVTLESSEIKEENNTQLEYQYYKKIVNPEEIQYLRIIKEIIYNGSERSDRTGVGTVSQFGKTMRFDLSGGKIPLLTTKRVFWRGVAEELLWFISGSTNSNELSEKGIRIWEGNTSREYLDKMGFTDRPVGDIGNGYSHQWRHSGAEYKDMYTNYEGKGVDQLKESINLIKNNPTSRRIIVCSWIPQDIPNMSLPPCHCLYQFYVNNNKLSCQMYQRSADMGLGVPFNIASYSLLTHLVAHCTNLEPGEFIHILGDAHVYKNHIDPLKEQIQRTPSEFPKLKINTTNKDIEKFNYNDLEIVGYKPQKGIKMEMAV